MPTTHDALKKRSPVPIGRAIIHRKTGILAGPIAPIFEEDWPFQMVDDHETLWRYMDFFKFQDLMESSSLYFSRPDRFEDPFEGRFSTGNQNSLSKSEAAFRQLYNIADPDSDDYIEVHRNVVFILCWHRSLRESREMWNAYTTSRDSVVITTSVRAIRRFTPTTLMKYGVKYSPLDNPRTEFSHNSLFYYKPPEYSFEREFRMLRSPDEGEVFYSENPDDIYRRVRIELRKIIHRVVLHPECSEETSERVSGLLQKHLPKIKAMPSSLDVRRHRSKRR